MDLKYSWGGDAVVALAISGGVDSMVLYHLLKTSYADTFTGLILLHVNHGRRAASIKEAAYIEQMAERDGILCETTVLDMPRERFSQSAARDARYQFFDRMMTRHGASFLLTAHHLDDQYETVLHDIFTGRYLPGKAGIPSRRDTGDYCIERPLMEVSRSEIEAYASQKDITYFEDETNSSTDYTRNYIRHNLMRHIKASPHLQEQQLLKLTEDLSDIDGMLQEQADHFLKTSSPRLSRASLNNERRLVRFYILNSWLASCGHHMRRRYIEEMMDVLESDTPQITFPADEVEIVVSYDDIYIRQEAGGIIERLGIEGNGTYEFNGYRITVEIEEKELPLMIRTRRRGDRMSIPGTGSKKLSRIFIDNKIPDEERSRMPVVINKDHQIIALGTIYNIIKWQGDNGQLRIEKEYDDEY